MDKTPQGKRNKCSRNRDRVTSSIFFTLKNSDNEDETNMDTQDPPNHNRHNLQERYFICNEIYFDSIPYKPSLEKQIKILSK